MKSNPRLLLTVCILAVAGLLAFQFYWISNYYGVNKTGFGREVNLAFEDAVKKEFQIRCDTITRLIIKKVMDTTQFRLSARLRPEDQTVEYKLSDVVVKKDSWSFSLHGINELINPGDTIVTKKVINRFAETLREHDLENHLVWYRTQKLGRFMVDKVAEFNFDTVRLRRVFDHYLAARGIAVPYQFYLRENDSTTNASTFPTSLTAKFPVITKSFPTYKLVEDNRFVRAMFSDPFTYVVSKMRFIFVSSVLLTLLVAGCMYLLFRMWAKEKKISAIKNDFIGNITHEFKTPITTVSAALESLADHSALLNDEKSTRYLMHSKKEMQRLSDLVDKVLNISIYENNLLTIAPEKINIEASINAIIQSHLMATRKNIQFRFTNSTGVTDLSADRVQFFHAVNNIVDNAIKYSGDNVAITVDCALQNGFFILSFADNGHGIAETEKALIFEKFYRVKTQDYHAVKGYGLGLHYVRHILEIHGGWCRIDSTVGGGSVFSLAWPHER